MATATATAMRVEVILDTGFETVDIVRQNQVVAHAEGVRSERDAAEAVGRFGFESVDGAWTALGNERFATPARPA